LKIGRVHQKLVGPHPRWSCQIAFTSKDFEPLIKWLDDNRAGLTVFVHALTGDDLKDHTDYAYWLGDSVDLDLSLFTDTRPGVV
jgi:DOPA 4,5-dioxygenase